VSSFSRALNLQPNRIDTRINRATALRLLRRPAEALADYDAVLAIVPDRLDMLIARGNALHELRRFDEALASFERALAIKPDFAEVGNNCGNALWELRRFSEALAKYEYALALKPDYAEAHINRGNALKGPQQTIASYGAALALDSDAAEAHWNKALAQLALGRFAEGWRNYEWRWRRARALTRSFPVPQWRSEAMEGRTILLHAEQGFGNTIQFVRYLPMVPALGARVVLEAPDALKPLLEGLPGIVSIIARGETLPAIDLHCPLMSLPLTFNTALDTIPAGVPYLAAPATYALKWAERLPPSGQPRVGLAWSGNPMHRDAHNRSIALARFAPLLDLFGIEFVSLQRPRCRPPRTA
jgi:tetratricopeptide (TPR) repeat protein